MPSADSGRSSSTSSSAVLSRRLGLSDAVFIGVGSMVGAGIFAAFAPAAQAAGSGLLIGLVVAAVVAFGNATSTAQLAARWPTSGGVYAFGREQLGNWWGFVAGWSFVVGKVASCAAMAITFAAYAAPAGWERPVAAFAVVALVTVNCFGITRTAQLTRIIVVVVLLCLAVVVASGLSVGGSVLPGTSAVGVEPVAASFADALLAEGWYGVLQSAGLLFFAFAGYARIATMGEEVRNPRRTIPTAIILALSLAIIVYGVVAFAALSAIGPNELAVSEAPLSDVVAASGWVWAEVVVRVGGSAASLGALLALIAGIGRTSFAMAREADLPVAFSVVSRRFRTPYRSEIAVGVVVLVLVVAVDVRDAIGFSSFGVLLYYVVANVAAFTQSGSDRRFPRFFQVVGLVGCLLLMFTLPWLSIVFGLVVVFVGVAYRFVRLWLGYRAGAGVL